MEQKTDAGKNEQTLSYKMLYHVILKVLVDSLYERCFLKKVIILGDTESVINLD